MALAFPDAYEVGMSHLGLKILYHIVNNLEFASAERVFAPWLDLGAALRSGGELLAALESGRPLREFDVVGFSLQYELAYPTVLDMLDLGGIPLRTSERLDRNAGPLVIAGGPCTVNPLPMSPFIDAFLIGDGEEAVPEMLAAYHAWKTSGSTDRHALLAQLSRIAGVFVPAIGTAAPVTRRYIGSLENAPYPESPVVPYAGIIHDRVNIEISRGCTMGCRFCQAGMIYRPVRERSPGRIMEIAEKTVRSTGYDAVSFTSLSSGDYSCLSPLMAAFNRKFRGERVALSLPSLRVASVTAEMLDELQATRKSGFTMAPEAGTDRLRAVINKDFTEEMYVQALHHLFRAGWQTVKLYFMSGLPTETDEDLAAIPEMVMKAIRISKKLTGRHVTINVGISSFVPKPHTPFQWCGQNPVDVLREKNARLRRSLLKRGVQYKGHDEDMSLLEAVLARGDERLSGFIEEAWRLGSRLDAWTEAFDFNRWKEAAEKTGIDAFAYATREYAMDESLPWSVIDIGVSRTFLLKEYRAALAGTFTSDCRKLCHACGLKCPSPGTDNSPESPQAGPSASLSRSITDQDVFLRARLRFTKAGPARFLSHLELGNALIRAMRRARFPFRYSSGFHPAPRISFGPALGVGIAGLREYIDIELIPQFDLAGLVSSLNATLPEGLAVTLARQIHHRDSLTGFVVRYLYEVRSGNALDLGRYYERSEIPVARKTGSVDLKTMVEDITLPDAFTARLMLRDVGEHKVRLDEIAQEVFGVPAIELGITRLAMYGLDNTAWKEPLEGDTAWEAKY
ncbi:MAG: TIGR03960 family B12-binding radical SAM protein [Thermodesulfovibrionales bacterium]